MSLLDFLQRRVQRRASREAALLARLGARIPVDGAPGLLPPGDPAEADAERHMGERFAAELHAYGAREPIGLARRLAAVASAARRRKEGELAEALEGLHPWELPALLEALRARTDPPREALVATARTLAGRTGDWEVLAAALGLVGIAPAPEDLPLLERAARSVALAGVCAMSAEPLGMQALLRLARVSEGLGRSLVVERIGMATADQPEELAPVAAEAIALAGTIEDPAARAYAAVPLLEVSDVSSLVAADTALAAPVAACLEAAARGGWNGGPGPGLGRLPGAIQAAEAVLASEAPLEVRRRAAQAVLDSHPMPPGPVRTSAQNVLAGTAIASKD